MTLWGLFTGLSQTTPWALHARLKAAEDEIKDLWEYVTEQTKQIARLGEIMARTAEETAARIDAATNEIVADIRAGRDDIAALKQQMDAGTAAAVDEALAKLDTPIGRLEAAGSDPGDPVPSTEPIPE